MHCLSKSIRTLHLHISWASILKRKIRKSHKKRKTKKKIELIITWNSRLSYSFTRYAFLGNLLQFFDRYIRISFLTKSYRSTNTNVHSRCIYKKAHIKLMHFNFSFDSHTNDDIDFEATLRRQGFFFITIFVCSQKKLFEKLIFFCREEKGKIFFCCRNEENFLLFDDARWCRFNMLFGKVKKSLKEKK